MLIIFALSACHEVTDGWGNLDSRIYMAGVYWEDNTKKACYWVNGKQVNLDTPAGFDSHAMAITVINGTVYIAGTYTDRNNLSANNTACFWINGIKTDLIVPEGVGYAVASDIVVSNKNIYIAGYYFTDGNYSYDSDSVVACYWKNGERIDMIEKGSSASAIAIQNDTVYLAGEYRVACFAGEYYVGNNTKPCYWINGKKIYLDIPPESGDAYINDIYLSEGKIYVFGNVSINFRTQSCYWIDGVRTDVSLYFADAYESDVSAVVSTIAVFNDKIYKSGTYTIKISSSFRERGFYSVDGTITPLSVPDETNYIYVRDIAVLDGKVYIVGHYYIGGWATGGLGFHGDQAACYWIDGIRTDISSDIEIYTITIADKD